MINEKINPHLARAIAGGVELHDVIQGEIMTRLVELQEEGGEYSKGYNDALSDIYALCYDVIFYKQDLKKGKL